ncbi:hypothetical protein E3983_10615 [Legionella israelensis]|uniref:Uncharacterized protein n=1 Tax=Legionella israelensis TaxID=454 RepID=A0AAX1EII0_9GAMM|nr:DUF6790 family protein [Legionella israelensis]QBR84765.1 hypothetical protein E3983_10615 [Legionella israelensis]
MINNILLIACILFATVHYLIKRKHYSAEQIVDLYLVYFLFFTVGLIGLTGFISHVFFPDKTAEMIGWPTGSPFQFEVGFHDGAWALLGILSLFIRGNFWLATGLGWSFFIIGALYGHIRDMILHGNFSPYNAGIILSEVIIPIVILILLFLKFVVFKKK